MADAKRLTRSESDRMIAGVCGGIADFFGIDPTLVRVMFALLAIFGGGGILLYVVMWAIVPRSSRVDAEPREVVRDSIEEGRELLHESSDAAKRTDQRLRGAETETGSDADDTSEDSAA